MSPAATANHSELNRWLTLLTELFDKVDGWAKQRDWSTRRIEKRLDDRELGPHLVPALLLQKEAVRMILEPITRNAPGADGVVDLYLLPAYDDIASLYHENGNWQLHYMFPEGEVVGNIRDAASKPLTGDSLGEVMDEMMKHAVSLQ